MSKSFEEVVKEFAEQNNLSQKEAKEILKEYFERQLELVWKKHTN